MFRIATKLLRDRFRCEAMTIDPYQNEEALVREHLLAEAAEARRQVRLPSPGLIWWKAQLQARQAAAERSTRPITIMQKLAAAAGGAAGLGLLAWSLPDASPTFSLLVGAGLLVLLLSAAGSWWALRAP